MIYLKYIYISPNQLIGRRTPKNCFFENSGTVYTLPFLCLTSIWNLWSLYFSESEFLTRYLTQCKCFELIINGQG
jgi:hypothetical protein